MRSAACRGTRTIRATFCGWIKPEPQIMSTNLGLRIGLFLGVHLGLLAGVLALFNAQ
jgi:hypothetical protein